LVTADGAPEPVPVDEPVIDTVALLGEPMVPPELGLDRDTVNVFVPENGVAFDTGTEKLFAAESPAAQLKVPLTAV
jgi:hypothetical protein